MKVKINFHYRHTDLQYFVAHTDHCFKYVLAEHSRTLLWVNGCQICNAMLFNSWFNNIINVLSVVLSFLVSPSDYQNNFTVDQVTGVIRVVTELDFEEIKDTITIPLKVRTDK